VCPQLVRGQAGKPDRRGRRVEAAATEVLDPEHRPLGRREHEIVGAAAVDLDGQVLTDDRSSRMNRGSGTERD
jgi:hypothetical protein